MSKVIVKIKDKDASNIIRKCLNKAEFLYMPTRPYEILAECFAAFLKKQNPKFNATNFVKKCTTDYKGESIHCHN